MIRATILEGDPILRQVMPDINDIKEAQRIIKDLKDTMYATDAIGFAANQIGELWNICIVSRYKGGVISFINPKIVAQKGSQLSIEGCKSIPDYTATVPRAKQILIAHGLPLKGTTLVGMSCIIAQHEIDHLNGILIRDYVENTNGKSGGFE